MTVVHVIFHSETVRLILNSIIGCWGYTLDREDKVSEDKSVTICIAVTRAEILGKVIQEQRDRAREI
jgi:hypothetical protein